MICIKLCRFIFLTGLLVISVKGAQDQQSVIEIQADHITHPVSRYLTGACIEDVNHEIYGGIYSQMIFGESFQETAPSAVVGFKSYGGEWSARDGVVAVHGLNGSKLVSDHGFKDGAVGVDVMFTNRVAGNAGLIIRTTKLVAGSDKFFGYEISLEPAQQTVRLGRHRNDFKMIKEAPCEIAIGEWIPLEVRMTGSVIEILVNGKSLLRDDDEGNALLEGAVGLRDSNCEASFRKLWIKKEDVDEHLLFVQSAEPPGISSMWRGVHRDTAAGHFAIVVDHPFLGNQSQLVSFDSGQGEWGLENQGLNHWGLSFIAGQPYEGYVWVRAGKRTELIAALESRYGSMIYAETTLTVVSNDWQRLNFTLTPTINDKGGRFVLKLKEPGSVTLGHVFLQPGGWGLFKGLPVRRDIAEGLINQGITVLRYGGSMVNTSGYKWKKMIGPRDRREPYRGAWHPYSSRGWGILDFMDFCEAAGFEYVPTFNIDETPQDMADFIEYAKGAADTKWGRRRVADGHPQPYHLRYMELGNEDRVDENYADKFEALAKAIWAKNKDVILVVGDGGYEKSIEDPFNFEGAGSGITTLAAQQRILQLAKSYDCEVWFDAHVGTKSPVPHNESLEGVLSFADALDKVADGARHKVAVLEFNADNHALKRALANAQAILTIERDGRIPIATSANGLQPDGQNDNRWDQGLLFFNSSRVWLQPPGYVTQMISHNYLPAEVQCGVSEAQGPGLDAAATRSEDGKTLVLQVVNATTNEVTTQIHLGGFVPNKTVAQVTELAGPPDAVNTADQPAAIIPKKSQWRHGIKDGRVTHMFPPNSFTVLRFE